MRKLLETRLVYYTTITAKIVYQYRKLVRYSHQFNKFLGRTS